MFPPAVLAPGVRNSPRLLTSPDSGEMVCYAMLAFLTCLPLTIVADTCVVDQGGTSTLCSSMARSQCESSNGLCKWEETQASTFLNNAKCLCKGSCLDKEDGLSSCTLLTTKADCANLGGNLGCLWWDPNQCSSESSLWLGRFGCTSQSACDSTKRMIWETSSAKRIQIGLKKGLTWRLEVKAGALKHAIRHTLCQDVRVETFQGKREMTCIMPTKRNANNFQAATGRTSDATHCAPTAQKLGIWMSRFWLVYSMASDGCSHQLPGNMSSQRQCNKPTRRIGEGRSWIEVNCSFSKRISHKSQINVISCFWSLVFSAAFWNICVDLALMWLL